MTPRQISRPAQRPRRRAAAAAAKCGRWHMSGVVALIIVVAGLLCAWRYAGTRPDGSRRLTMAQARASNAAVAIEEDRRVPAAPYRFRGSPAAREQATECLATAALYEVGADPRGQKAVMQVILNRVRLPGYPHTICGVVYQGHARETGCQFSFTCDGSFDRRPVHRGWSAARRAARSALGGEVFADVGGATQYHADWTVPYWRNSLVKVARVGSHLFYVGS